MTDLLIAAWALRYLFGAAVLVCIVYATLPKHPNQ